MGDQEQDDVYRSPREEAAKRGETVYQGTSCRHGHDGRRYVRTGACVQCGNAHAKVRNDRIRRLQDEARAAAKAPEASS